VNLSCHRRRSRRFSNRASLPNRKRSHRWVARESFDCVTFAAIFSLSLCAIREGHLGSKSDASSNSVPIASCQVAQRGCKFGGQGTGNLTKSLHCHSGSRKNQSHRSRALTRWASGQRGPIDLDRECGGPVRKAEQALLKERELLCFTRTNPTRRKFAPGNDGLWLVERLG
jgi:hypothetical protein